MPDSLRERILNLWNGGLTAGKIAKMVGLTSGGVVYHLRRADIPRRDVMERRRAPLIMGFCAGCNRFFSYRLISKREQRFCSQKCYFENYIPPLKGKRFPEASKAILSQKIKLKYKDPVYLQKIALRKSGWFGPKPQWFKDMVSRRHKGQKLSSETKMKLSLSKRGRPSPLRGRICPEAVRRRISDSTKLAMKRPDVMEKMGKLQRNIQTSIELVAQESLARHGLTFIVHAPIDGVCIADIRLLDYKIAIFCDGCYWHGCHLCTCGARGRKLRKWSPEKDANITHALELKGWRVLRFWEHDLNLNPDIVGMTVSANLMPDEHDVVLSNA